MGRSTFAGGFAGGVTIRGIPITVTHPGEVFWVNSTAILPVGGKSPSGNSPGTYLEPVATVAQALDLCKANRGDIVMIMPGYTETIGATDLALDVAGVAIVGMGSGGLKPVFTYSAAGSTVNATAANVSVYNCRFVTGIINCVAGITVTGPGFSIDSCEFMTSLAAVDFKTSITASTAAIGLSVTNCTINMESSTLGVAVTEVAETGISTQADNSFIAGNSILGNFSISTIYNVTNAILGSSIIDNDIYNVATTVATLVTVAAGSSGLIMRNMGMTLDTANVAALIVNPAMAMSENYAVNVITETGGVVGTAST